MLETVCSSCGAIATNAGDFRICPHCGQDSAQTLARSPISSGRWLFPLLLIISGAAPVLSIFFQIEWKYWVIAASVLVAGIGWTLVARKIRNEYYDPTAGLATLNGRARATNYTQDEAGSSPIRMPATPGVWKTLVSAPRPREVYLPTGATVSFSFFGAFLCFLAAGLWWASSHHRGAFAHRGLASSLGTAAQLLGSRSGQPCNVLAGGEIEKVAS